MLTEKLLATKTDSELFKAEIDQYLKSANSKSILARCVSAIINMIKVVISLVFPLFVEHESGQIADAVQKTAQTAENSGFDQTFLRYMIVLAISVIVLFAVSYTVLTIIFAVIEFIWQCLFSTRHMRTTRERARITYHHITFKQIQLTVASESDLRKLTSHLLTTVFGEKIELTEEINHPVRPMGALDRLEFEIQLDTICSRSSEAMFNIRGALNGLKEVIPPNRGNWVKRHNNQGFCSYIGLNDLWTGVHILKNALTRLSAIQQSCIKQKNEIHSALLRCDGFDILSMHNAELLVCQQRLETIIEHLRQYK